MTGIRHLYWNDETLDFEERLDETQKNNVSTTESSPNQSDLSNQSILHTEDFGEITLPLSSKEAEELRQKICKNKLEICKNNCSIVQVCTIVLIQIF
jgi:hypothetical protein